MSKKPVVGLVPMVNEEKSRCEMPWSYCRALEGAGALPVILPLLTDPADLAQAVSVCGGILLTGGPDVDPARYGEETLPACGQIIPQRDEMEDLLFQAALAADKPVLGICRGVQAMNVALGGTLWQDLPTQVGGPLIHSQSRPYDKTWHKVSVTPGTPLAELLGVEELAVTSRHHQAVKDVAPAGGSGLDAGQTVCLGSPVAPGKRIPDQPGQPETVCRFCEPVPVREALWKYVL